MCIRDRQHIQFLENPLFNEANNISSAWVARGLLQSAYVCEADLLLKNPLLIRKYEYVSNYLGRYTDYTCLLYTSRCV